MGNLKDLMGMIPGMGKMLRNVDLDDDAFNGVECLIQSMTKYERENPTMIDKSRKARIARGSGKDIGDVNRLLKQFEDMRKMMKLMSKGSGGKRGRVAGLSGLQ